MSRSHTFFRHFPSLVLFALLPVSLAGCGDANDDETQAQDAGSRQAAPADGEAERPVAPRGQNQGGRRHEAKAHVTLTGALQLDSDVAMACGVYQDKGLQFSFDETGQRAPRVQVRVYDYANPGEYNATVVIQEHPESGAVREWNGAAKINLQARTVGRARKRTAFNGTFNGTYQGTGGSGTLSGNFRRCTLTGMDQ
jgi:hypothetical protein